MILAECFFALKQRSGKFACNLTSLGQRTHSYRSLDSGRAAFISFAALPAATSPVHRLQLLLALLTCKPILVHSVSNSESLFHSCKLGLCHRCIYAETQALCTVWSDHVLAHRLLRPAAMQTFSVQ